MTQILNGAILAEIDVSRETEALLKDFVAMLVKWNSAINLVSKGTIDQIWSRHIVDSMQIFQVGKGAKHWADLGAGGGLPGLVVAIMALEKAPHMQITLVESDQRKAAFLRQAGQTFGLNLRVMSERIETIAPLEACMVSARALAPLTTLCSFAKRHLAPGGRAVFLKGKTAQTEINEARNNWRFLLESYQSSTDAAASILVLTDIEYA